MFSELIVSLMLWREQLIINLNKRKSWKSWNIKKKKNYHYLCHCSEEKVPFTSTESGHVNWSTGCQGNINHIRIFKPHYTKFNKSPFNPSSWSQSRVYISFLCILKILHLWCWLFVREKAEEVETSKRKEKLPLPLSLQWRKSLFHFHRNWSCKLKHWLPTNIYHIWIFIPHVRTQHSTITEKQSRKG